MEEYALPEHAVLASDWARARLPLLAKERISSSVVLGDDLSDTPTASHILVGTTRGRLLHLTVASDDPSNDEFLHQPVQRSNMHGQSEPSSPDVRSVSSRYSLPPGSAASSVSSSMCITEGGRWQVGKGPLSSLLAWPPSSSAHPVTVAALCDGFVRLLFLSHSVDRDSSRSTAEDATGTAATADLASLARTASSLSSRDTHAQQGTHQLQLAHGPPVGPPSGVLLLAHGPPLDSPILTDKFQTVAFRGDTTSGYDCDMGSPVIPCGSLLIVLRRKVLVFAFHWAASHTRHTSHAAEQQQQQQDLQQQNPDIRVVLIADVTLQELGERETPQCAACLSSSVVLATQSQYLRVDLKSGTTMQLFPLPADTRTPPIVAATPLLAHSPTAPAVVASPALSFSAPSAMLPVVSGQVEMELSAILVMDNVGVVVDNQGNPKGSTLLFPSPPLQLTSMPPYVVALLLDSRLVVYHAKQGAAMQAVKLPSSWGLQGRAAAPGTAGFNMGLGFLSGSQPLGPQSPSAISLAAVASMHTQAVVLAMNAEVCFLPCLGPSMEARLLIRQKRYSEATAYLKEFLAYHWHWHDDHGTVVAPNSLHGWQSGRAWGWEDGQERGAGALQRSADGLLPAAVRTAAARTADGLSATMSTAVQRKAAADRGLASSVVSSAISSMNDLHSIPPASQAGAAAAAAAAIGLLCSAHAQIGALLLFDLEFERAVDHLIAAGPQAFRPTELFALFPHLTARWHALIPRSRLWGLHPPLSSLHDRLNCCCYALAANVPAHAPAAASDAASQRVKTPVATAPPPAAARVSLPLPETQPVAAAAVGTGAAAVVVQGGRNVGQIGSGAAGGAGRTVDVRRSCQAAIVRYLRHVRQHWSDHCSPSPLLSAERGREGEREGEREREKERKLTRQAEVSEQGGIDTLLLLLLLCLGDYEGAAQLCCGPQLHCVMDDVEGPLLHHRQHRLVAQLRAQRADVAGALDMWRHIALTNAAATTAAAGPASAAAVGSAPASDRDSVPGSKGTQQEQQQQLQWQQQRLWKDEAVREAAKLLEAISDWSLLQQHLRWLIEISPPHALAVVTSSSHEKELFADAVLQLISRESKTPSLVWRYLWWLVHEKKSEEQRYHTQLALCLLQLCTLQAQAQALAQAQAQAQGQAQGQASAQAQAQAHAGAGAGAGSGAGATGTGGSSAVHHKSGPVTGRTMLDDHASKSSSSPANGSRSRIRVSSSSSRGVNRSREEKAVRWLLIARGRLGKERGIARASSNNHHHLPAKSGRGGVLVEAGGEMMLQEEEEEEAERSEEMGRDGVAADVTVGRQSHAAVKLMEHLVQSELYDAEAVWEVVCKQEGMAYQQASVLCRMGRHPQALRLLALDMRDTEAAEAYCLHVGDAATCQCLLDLYLIPGSDRPPMIDAALSLMRCAGHFVNPLRIFNALPNDCSVVETLPVIAQLLRDRLHTRLQGQIVHQLARAENGSLRAARAELLSRYHIVPPIQLGVVQAACSNCEKGIDEFGPFVALPSLAILCMECHTSSGQSAS